MSHAPSHALSARHEQIRRVMREQALDALVVTARPNITYLTNFTGSTAIAVVTREALTFLTDSRYVTALAATRGQAWECPTLDLSVVAGSYDAALAAVLHGTGAERVGFEAAHVTVRRHAWWSSALGNAVTLVPTADVVESARVVKDSYEQDTLREAGRRLSDVARGVVSEVRSGQRESEVALRIDICLREAGFSGSAFETIVASGPNAALPHARPGERKLSEGDLVVLDFGGVYDSYCVDLTRTLAIGPVSSRVRRVYDAVRAAHDRAIAQAGPGQSRFAIDAAARNLLIDAGMGEAFGHGTGHGLGIEVHEDPRITERRPDVDVRHEFMTPGMVFTIEPGAYFPGWGGVRIEDDVLVTETGVDLLTDATTELLEID